MHIRINDMPVLRPIPDWTKSKWIINSNWHFKLDSGITIIIPAGFLTDLVSIPRIFWSIISPFGSLLFAGIIHDFGYKYNYLWAIHENGNVYKYGYNQDRWFWDELFLKIANQTNHSPKFNAFAASFLPVFGRTSWDEYRNNPQPEVQVRL
jgi:hypothetical protein